jgi:short-subunit dehydrogenase
MRTVVISGASSGIGAALALRYAREGCRLGLLGRSEQRLAEVAEACKALGATAETARIDIRDRAAMAAWLGAFDGRSPIDLLIANAGVMAGTAPDGAFEEAEASFEVFSANMLGIVNLVHPILPRMIERKRGQIAIMSSIAAFVPLPDAPSYSASKAAALNYGLSLRAALLPNGIKVSVICPGYVTTPMSRQEIGSKPFEMTAGRAAETIVAALERNRAVIVFPKGFGLATRMLGLLPEPLRRRLNNFFRFRVMPRSG